MKRLATRRALHPRMRPRLTLSLLFLSSCGTALPGPAFGAAGTKHTDDTEDDRFEPWAFLGEVKNRFAASRGLVDQDPRDEDDKTVVVDTASGSGGGSGQFLEVLRDGKALEALASVKLLRTINWISR